MTSDSRKQFEEWAKARSLNPVRSSAGGYMELACALSWQGWSARDSEVERLREALEEARLALIEACGFPPHAINVQVANAAHNARRALMSSQVKESGK